MIKVEPVLVGDKSAIGRDWITRYGVIRPIPWW